jgi:hypothetical protein
VLSQTFAEKCTDARLRQIRLLNQRRQKEVNRVVAETALDMEIRAAEQDVRNRERVHVR